MAEKSTTGEILIRVLYTMETVAWAALVFLGVSLRSSTLEADFPNRQMSLNGEAVLICWAGLMLLLAIAGLVRARGLLFKSPGAAGVVVAMRLFTLVPLTALMLIIAAAGFAA